MAERAGVTQNEHRHQGRWHFHAHPGGDGGHGPGGNHGHGPGHGHGHGHGNGNGNGGVRRAEKALWVSLALNVGFLAVELAVGLWSNSLALLSDAGHMLADVAALSLAVAAERLARFNPGGSYTFGLKRVPVLGAFGNAFSLLAIVAVIFWEAANRLAHPPPVLGEPVLVVGTIGLLINLVSAWWLYRTGELSLNVRGALVHLLADALGSLGAMASALVLIITGWRLVDPLISFVIGGLILAGTLPVLRDSVKVLLQAAPTRIDMGRLRRMLVEGPAVQDVADLHVWELNSGQVVLTAVLISDHSCVEDLQDAGDRLRTELQQHFGIAHATFEWRTSTREPLGLDCS